MKNRIYLSLLLLFALQQLNAQNIFPATGRAGIHTTSPSAALQVRGGARFGTSTTNFVNIDSATGNLSFNGSSQYRVGGNQYAFAFAGNPNYGLFFNQTSVRYEFRNNAAAPSFFVGADDGNGVFTGGVRVGNSNSNVAGNIRWTGTDFEGFNGVIWKSLTLTGNGSVGWSITGNAQTEPVNNFIGTTDNQSLSFRVNNEAAGQLDAKFRGTYFGIGTPSNNSTYGLYNSAFGTDALKNNNGGGENTAVGSFALTENSEGYGNTAMGLNALNNNTTGSENTATGRYSLSGNTTGIANTAAGSFSLFSNTTGRSNTAIGNSSLDGNKSGSSNVSVGANALFLNATGFSNVAVGKDALNKNIGGSNIVAIGDSALFNQNGGDGQNTAIGSKALFANTTGEANSALGFRSLFANTTGFYNTAMGSGTLTSNTTGTYNTATGTEALFNNTIGSDNTAAGANALFSNTTGSSNTALGSSAMVSNTTGGDNTAVGYYALIANLTGSSNTAVGTEALSSNVTGSFNTAIGKYALLSNSGGSNNVAVGESSLLFNVIGKGNVAIGTAALGKNNNLNNQVAIGDSALYNLNGGSGFNTAVGNKALFTSTTGQENAAFGFASLQRTTTGNYNTAFGTSSLTNNTSGASNTAVGTNAIAKGTTSSDNTAVGTNALNNTTTGGGNTAVGRSALTTNTTGTNNTVIGSSANVSTGALTNATALGNGAITDASNRIRFGNTSVTSIGGTVGYSTLSDGRFKQNIKEETHGLDFIKLLKPVSYNYDLNSIDNFLGVKEDKEINTANTEAQKGKTAQSKNRYNGFLAQEVDKAAQSLNYNFSGIDKPADDSKSTWGLRYGDFVVPLVKAVQELSAENDDLKKQNEEQKKINNDLQQQINELRTMITGSSNTTVDRLLPIQHADLSSAATPSLAQNIPNPFKGQTTINYYLPQNANNAVIKLTAADGKLIKTVTLSAKGSGQLNLQTAQLAAGTYRYSLIVDAKLIDTKTMVVIK